MGSRWGQGVRSRGPLPALPCAASHQRHHLGELCRIVGRVLSEAYRALLQSLLEDQAVDENYGSEADELAAQRLLGGQPGAYRGQRCPRAQGAGSLHDPGALLSGQDPVHAEATPAILPPNGKSAIAVRRSCSAWPSAMPSWRIRTRPTPLGCLTSTAIRTTHVCEPRPGMPPCSTLPTRASSTATAPDNRSRSAQTLATRQHCSIVQATRSLTPRVRCRGRWARPDILRQSEQTAHPLPKKAPYSGESHRTIR